MTNFSFLLRLDICFLYFFYLGSRLPQEIIIQGHSPPPPPSPCTVFLMRNEGLENLILYIYTKENERKGKTEIYLLDQLTNYVVFLARWKREENLFSVSNGMYF